MKPPAYRKVVYGTGGSVYFTIPSPIARRLSIKKGDAVIITTSENAIVATPYSLNTNKTHKDKGYED